MTALAMATLTASGLTGLASTANAGTSAPAGSEARQIAATAMTVRDSAVAPALSAASPTGCWRCRWDGRQCWWDRHCFRGHEFRRDFRHDRDFRHHRDFRDFHRHGGHGGHGGHGHGGHGGHGGGGHHW